MEQNYENIWNDLKEIERFERILKEIARPSLSQVFKWKHFQLKHPSKATYGYIMDTLTRTFFKVGTFFRNKKSKLKLIQNKNAKEIIYNCFL